MNWVDLLVVVLALAAAVSGARSGLVTALFSFLGVIVGAIVGLKVAPLLLEHLNNEAARIGFGVGIVSCSWRSARRSACGRGESCATASPPRS